MSISIAPGSITPARCDLAGGCGKKDEEAADAGRRAGAGARRRRKKRSSTSTTGRTTSPRTRSRTSPQKTGIKVTYDVFDSNDVLETKLLAGNTGYDVVVPSASFLERQIKAGVFQQARQAASCRTGATSIRRSCSASRCTTRATSTPSTYLWGTDGIGYNEAKIKKIMAERAGRQLEHDLRPEDRREIQGLRHLGARRARPRCSTVMLTYLGQDPNSQKPSRPEGRRRQADDDPPLHPHDPHLAVHRRLSPTARSASRSAGAATSCRRATAPTEAGQGNVIKYCDPEGRHDHLVRHARDSGGRASIRRTRTRSSTS